MINLKAKLIKCNQFNDSRNGTELVVTNELDEEVKQRILLNRSR